MGTKRPVGRPPERAKDPTAKERIKLAADIMASIDEAVPKSEVPQANRRADRYIRGLQKQIAERASGPGASNSKDVAVLYVLTALLELCKREFEIVKVAREGLLELGRNQARVELHLEPERELEIAGRLRTSEQLAEASSQERTFLLQTIRGLVHDYPRPGSLGQSKHFPALLLNVFTDAELQHLAKAEEESIAKAKAKRAAIQPPQ